MSKQVTAEDVVEWIQKVQKVYRVEEYAKNFADKINALLAKRDAENERLRAALAVFADPKNWDATPCCGILWNAMSGQQEFAAEALKGGQPCPGK